MNLQIDNKYRNTESLITFQEWWNKRISPIEGLNRPVMPDFFEVWDARQPLIDELKKENEYLKNKIKIFEAKKPNG